jgi:DNA-binding NtrC family response regulator
MSSAVLSDNGLEQTPWVIGWGPVKVCEGRVSVSNKKRGIVNTTMNVIYLDKYRKAKVLVVAADRHIAEVLCEFLLTNELKVELADSFDKVLPVLSKKGVDMVLLTSFGMTSSRIPPLVTAVKNECPSIGVTVLSGDDGIQSDVMNRGADVFMPAPCCFKELLGRIRTILAVK